MRKNRKFITSTLGTVLVLLAACGNTSDDASSKPNNQAETNKSTEHATENAANQEPTESSSGSKNPEDNGQAESSIKETDEGASNKPDGTWSKKDEYLQKLNDLQKDLQTKTIDDTAVEMEQLQTEIFIKWDDTLNEIYGQLEAQLSPSQMEELREEQTTWISHRDEVAKEESLQFQGGSMESLTYITTQAKLTKERCYVLVKVYLE